MQLVTFGIDKEKNLIVQFSIFIQPYNQQPLIIYQLETVQVPILDQNYKSTFLHTFTNQKAIQCTEFRNVYLPTAAGTRIMCIENWL